MSCLMYVFLESGGIKAGHAFCICLFVLEPWFCSSYLRMWGRRGVRLTAYRCRSGCSFLSNQQDSVAEPLWLCYILRHFGLSRLGERCPECCCSCSAGQWYASTQGNRGAGRDTAASLFLSDQQVVCETKDKGAGVCTSEG